MKKQNRGMHFLYLLAVVALICVISIFLREMQELESEVLTAGVRKVECISTQMGRITDIKDIVVGDVNQPAVVAEVEHLENGVYVRTSALMWKERNHKRGDRVDMYRYKLTDAKGSEREYSLLTASRR
jgi:putative ubiquitin-RnfH superfamily antitoxin RatB of RatAB toxin-antitoxin module